MRAHVSTAMQSLEKDKDTAEAVAEKLSAKVSYLPARICTCASAHTHTFTEAHLHTRTHSRRHSYIHELIHTHACIILKALATSSTVFVTHIPM
jgi:hypothetical protein